LRIWIWRIVPYPRYLAASCRQLDEPATVDRRDVDDGRAGHLTAHAADTSATVATLCLSVIATPVPWFEVHGMHLHVQGRGS